MLGGCLSNLSLGWTNRRLYDVGWLSFESLARVDQSAGTLRIHRWELGKEVKENQENVPLFGQTKRNHQHLDWGTCAWVAYSVGGRRDHTDRKALVSLCVRVPWRASPYSGSSASGDL